MKKSSRGSKKKSGTYAHIPSRRTPRWRRGIQSLSRRRQIPSAPPMPMQFVPSAPPMPMQFVPSAPPMPMQFVPAADIAVAPPMIPPPPPPPPRQRRQWRALEGIRRIIRDGITIRGIDEQLNKHDANEELPNDWIRDINPDGRVIYVHTVHPSQVLFHPPESDSVAHGTRRTRRRKSRGKGKKSRVKKSKVKKSRGKK